MDLTYHTRIGQRTRISVIKNKIKRCRFGTAQSGKVIADRKVHGLKLGCGIAKNLGKVENLVHHVFKTPFAKDYFQYRHVC